MWVFGVRLVCRALNFFKTIILARLLVPEDFGLLAVGLLAVSMIENFSQTGFQAALVQKKENIETHLDTTWTVSIFRGFVLFAILFLSAPLIATFFDSPQTVKIIRALAFAPLITGFQNIGMIYFQKDLEFRKIFIYEFFVTLIEFSIAITLAFLLRNVWAMVWGILAANFVRVMASYIVHSYRPRLDVNKKKFDELFGFGKWVLSSGFLFFLINQGDDLFVGKFLGIAALGFYQLAYTIANLPATEITRTLSKVTFPVYAKVQDDLVVLEQTYINVIRFTALISLPLAGLIFSLSEDFTKICLGHKWLPMVPALKVLVLWGVIRSIGATTGPVFLGTGRPKIIAKLQFLQLTLLCILIYPLSIHFGIVGASMSVVLASFVPNLIAVVQALSCANCRIKSFATAIGPPFLSTLLIVGLIYALKTFWHPPTELFSFSAIALSAIMVYCVVTKGNLELIRMIKCRLD
jgi:O-antigen/teichoic acid export membrane protein